MYVKQDIFSTPALLGIYEGGVKSSRPHQLKCDKGQKRLAVYVAVDE